jgi:hypothetical protein
MPCITPLHAQNVMTSFNQSFTEYFKKLHEDLKQEIVRAICEISTDHSLNTGGLHFINPDDADPQLRSVLTSVKIDPSGDICGISALHDEYLTFELNTLGFEELQTILHQLEIQRNRTLAEHQSI